MSYQKLTIEQIKSLYNNGHTFVLLPSGKIKKITIDDLFVSKADVDKLLESLKKENK